MAKFKLDFGADVELLTKGELDDSLADANDALIRSAVAGIKYMRLPRLRGSAGDGALVLGDGSLGGSQSGPDSGFAWSIMRILVSGLTSGTTPDVVNLYRNGTNSDPIWQVNGDNFAYTFGRGQLVLLGSETLVAASVGSFAATGTITISGEAWEVPAEMIGKLA